MDWCTILELLIVGYVLMQIIRLIMADCDLQLQWAEKFGKSTGTLARKVVWITGASSGIGEHLAYEMAKAGCRLVLSARRETELERVKKECLTYGNLMDEDILVLPLDMLQFDLHKPSVDEVLSRYKQIDILINNAGRTQRALWVETDVEVDRQMFELNVFSVLSLTKLVLPHMIERNQGHIVYMSSLAGKMGVPGSASYAGAKHALQGYFNGLRAEVYDKNLKVTGICPGPVFSNHLDNAFTGKTGESLHGKMNPTEKRMSTTRCAQLSAIAIANNLDEAWISQHPPLIFLYIAQYCPVIYTWLLNKVGMEQVKKIREGR